MQITVSEVIVRYMERLGIETIFGMPGAHILPVYDRLYESTIEAILAKHEQGAAFMACGYSRASCKISACITTAGPGATNLVTGIANAYADRQPVLVITGETPTHIFGKGGLQESSGEGGSVDQVALFKGITRYNKIVERTDYLAQVLNQASSILLSANPGPVLLSFPLNVQRELVDASILDSVQTERRVHSAHDDSLSGLALLQLIREADNPVIVAGFGCINGRAQGQVTELSRRLGIPVATSLKAKGAVDEHSPLSLGSLGVTSAGHAYRYIVDRADLVIFLGAGFNERTSYVWEDKLLAGKKVAQVDSDYSQLGKVFDADLAIQGDIRETLEGILRHINGDAVSDSRRTAIEQEVSSLKGSATSDYAIFQSGFSLVEAIFAELERCFPSDTMVFDDNVIFAQNFYNVSSGNRYYPNSGISSLGHAIPAAIGATFAEEKSAFAILGDGGFQMCCMEIMTAVNYHKPLNIILFNNDSMGLIRKNQHQHYEGRFINCDFTNPDYELLARSFGIHYQRIEKGEDVPTMFGEGYHPGAINLFEVIIDKERYPDYSSKR